jgi:hypothetical protein
VSKDIWQDDCETLFDREVKGSGHDYYNHLRHYSVIFGGNEKNHLKPQKKIADP